MSKSKVNKYSDIVTTLIKTIFSMKDTIILIFIRILVNCKKKYIIRKQLTDENNTQ